MTIPFAQSAVLALGADMGFPARIYREGINVLRVFAYSILLIILLAGCESPEEKLPVICHDALKERLKAPSSFVEISRILKSSNPYTHDRMVSKTDAYYYDPETKDPKMKELNQILIASSKRTEAEGNRIISEYFITYEAQNSFGVMLRSSFDCLVVHDNEDADPKVYINGQTYFDWLIKNMRSP